MMTPSAGKRRRESSPGQPIKRSRLASNVRFQRYGQVQTPAIHVGSEQAKLIAQTAELFIETLVRLAVRVKSNTKQTKALMNRLDRDDILKTIAIFPEFWALSCRTNVDRMRIINKMLALNGEVKIKELRDMPWPISQPVQVILHPDNPLPDSKRKIENITEIHPYFLVDDPNAADLSIQASREEIVGGVNEIFLLPKPKKSPTKLSPKHRITPVFTRASEAFRSEREHSANLLDIIRASNDKDITKGSDRGGYGVDSGAVPIEPLFLLDDFGPAASPCL
ncbi:hypothetical protein AAMO2058_000856000 [Amorphochlora amoebiformis]